jgi:hypothetical protein
VMYHWWPPNLTAVSAGLSGLAGSKESAGASGSGSGWIAIHGAPEGAGITPFAIPSEHIRRCSGSEGSGGGQSPNVEQLELATSNEQLATSNATPRDAVVSLLIT